MRIRTIKPEFYQDEDLAQLPREVRLLAASLLVWADDEGYFRSHPALIAGALYPYDPDGKEFVHGGLTELSRSGFVQLFEGSVGFLPGFPRHQVINRPTKSKLKDKALKQLELVEIHGVLTESSRTEVEVEVEREVDLCGIDDPALPGVVGSGDLEPTPNWQPTVDRLDKDYLDARGAKYRWHKGDFKALKALLKSATPDEVCERWRLGLRGQYAKEVNTVMQLDSKWNALADGQPQPASRVVAKEPKPARQL
jgi:hypothetical protein